MGVIDVSEVKKLAKKNKVGFHQEGENPRLVLIGEEHNEPYLIFQEKAIELIKPKAIMHEAAQDESQVQT